MFEENFTNLVTVIDPIPTPLKDFLILYEKASQKVKITFQKKIFENIQQNIQLLSSYDSLKFEEIQEFDRMLLDLTKQNKKIEFEKDKSRRKFFNDFLLCYEQANKAQRNVLHEHLFLHLINTYKKKLSFLERSSFHGFWINVCTYTGSSKNHEMSEKDYILHSFRWSCFHLESFGVPADNVSNFKEFVTFLYQKTTFIERNEWKEFMKPILFD